MKRQETHEVSEEMHSLRQPAAWEDMTWTLSSVQLWPADVLAAFA